MADSNAPLFQLPDVMTREVYRVVLSSGAVVERAVSELTPAPAVERRGIARADTGFTAPAP